MSPNARLKAVFKRRFPRLLPRLEGSSKGHAATFRARSTDWSALVERWLEGVELKPNSVIALTGFGDGSHVAALLEKLPKRTYVFCGEADVSGFSSIARSGKVLSILEDPRFFLGLGSLDQACFESLSLLPLFEVRDALPIIFAPIYNAAPEYYAAFLTEFARSFDYWRKVIGTNVSESGKWQKNTFDNIPVLIGAPDIREAKDAFKGETVIMVSAGPSLDESLEFIAKHQERCVVIAVNSSYRALRNAGITPHFVLAVDPYKYTDMGFEGVDCDQTVLICPFMVFPKVVNRFEGRVLSWSGDNLLASYVRRKLGLDHGSKIAEMGTVSASVFDIAKLFGCRRIVFVGQDLAVKADGQMHATDSFYSDLKANHIGAKHCRELPGNVAESVRVEERLYVYLKVFEALAKEGGADMEFWNTSRLGVRIEGIPYLSLEEVTERLNAEPSDSSVEEKMRRVQAIMKKPIDLSDKRDAVYESMAMFAQKTVELALRGALTLETVEKEEGEAFQQALKRCKALQLELIQFFDRNYSLLSVLSDGALKFELTCYTLQKGRLDEIEDPLRRDIEDLKAYFWAVSEGAFSFLSALQESRKKAVEPEHVA